MLLPLALAALMTVGVGVPSDSLRIEPRPDFARHFEAAGMTGAFVAYLPDDRLALVHDPERVQQRFVPASTYKIPNALIALETGVVADTLEAFAWDGVERSVPAWNRDQTLGSAFRASTVWVYQAIARRIGEARMQAFLRQMGYGNENLGGGIDQFWLTGDLRIAPMEQVLFLERLHERRLPFSERSMALVEAIMIEDRGEEYVLRAKTGWALAEPVDVGWYVGYVVRADRTVYFALNADIERAEHVAARRTVALAILRDLGVL